MNVLVELLTFTSWKPEWVKLTLRPDLTAQFMVDSAHRRQVIILGSTKVETSLQSDCSMLFSVHTRTHSHTHTSCTCTYPPTIKPISADLQHRFLA